jgi:SAM-dependent methyltransferase
MHQPPKDSTTRFSNRVENYVRFRPSYPTGVLDILRQETSLSCASVIADIGSGTGISAELFLRNGNTVYGVEPNADMRRAAEAQLAGYPSFHSIAATAEATTLDAASADYVVSGQAFHWFDRSRAQQEFARILRPRGWVILFWNSRRIDSTPFLRAYESLLRKFSTDYETVEHKQIGPEMLRTFFAECKFESRCLPNEQWFDFEVLKGRLLSSSYAPTGEHPNYQLMIDELERAFRAHNEHGQVCFQYDTEIYFGHVEAVLQTRS